MSPADNIAEAARFAVFQRLWGIAVVAHIVGNWALQDIPSFSGSVNAVTGIVGLLLALQPSRRLFLVTCALGIVSVLGEMPVTGNHWVVAGLVAAAALVTRAEPGPFFATARLILLVFYSFAAFAKLNDGFLDPSVSCGVHFVDQWLDGFGLGSLDRSGPLAQLAVWGPTLTELAVPVLLLCRPLRPLGVLVATFFHSSISYDIHQHFYDFSALLLPLFFLFAPARTATSVAESFARLPLALRNVAFHAFAACGGLLVLAATLPATTPTRLLLATLPFVWWLPFSLWWLLTLARALAPGDRLRLAPPAAGWALVVVTFLNGLTPYTEIKTGFGYTMYANLVTANGESNHWIVRRTLPLRDGFAGPVEVVASSDAGLQKYVDERWLVAWPEFRRYVAARPDISVSYVRDGVRHEVARVGDDPLLSVAPSWWLRFVPLRSLDWQRPPRCQSVFLPAL